MKTEKVWKIKALRAPDSALPKLALYQAELHPERAWF
jgi:hypothetical protein